MSGKILCLEGEKSNSPHGKYSVQTMLEFLKQTRGIEFEHHRVATRAELDRRLKSYTLLPF